MSKYPKINFNDVQTYSIADRESKVNISEFAKTSTKESSIADFFNNLPNILAGQEFKDFIQTFRKAVAEKNTVILMMGAHVIKCGLSPLIVELVQQKIVSHIALNGAGVIHDTEIAMWGSTSEDVAEALKDGSFGMCQDTADFINNSLNDNLGNDKGYGESIAEKIVNSQAKNGELSILANCFKSDVPISVHPALGTEIIHQHPSLNGKAFGEKAQLDFQLFTTSVTQGRLMLLSTAKV